ncbi:MAG: hypothetical protein SOZ07_06700 [Prevotella sp.]|nr:hypothetical protein [Prevotella sp.]
MERNYIFVLYVNGKVHKTYNWFCEDEKTMRLLSIGLSAGARAFKKTAGVLVYQLQEDMNYHICHSVDFKSNWQVLHKTFSSQLVENKQNLTEKLGSMMGLTA